MEAYTKHHLWQKILLGESQLRFGEESEALRTLENSKRFKKNQENVQRKTSDDHSNQNYIVKNYSEESVLKTSE